MGEACSSGPYENRVEPHFQQHAIADDAFAVGSSGSSTKQTAHLSNRGARCRGQCVWNTNVHSLRIHDHFAVRLVNRVDPPADEFRAAEAAEQGRADVPGSSVLPATSASIGVNNNALVSLISVMVADEFV